MPYMLCVANTYPHKNVQTLVDAFRGLTAETACNLVLVGIEGRGEPLVQNALQHVPPGRFLRLGRLPREDLVALYQSADVFVFPSLYEGFGLPVLEAMAAGTPVIATDRASIPEIGGDSIVYFDGSVSGLTSSLRQMLGMDATKRQDMVAGARRRADLFTWQRTADETVACLRSLLRRP